MLSYTLDNKTEPVENNKVSSLEGIKYFEGNAGDVRILNEDVYINTDGGHDWMKIKGGKEFDCPDCTLQVTTCEGCPRAQGKFTRNINNDDYNTVKPYWSYTLSPACATCSNNPANGGNGICNCTLGVPEIR